MRIRRWAAVAAVPLVLSVVAPAEAATPTVAANRAPVAVISGAATGLGPAIDVDTDPSGRIYVLTTSAVRVFAPTARGNAAPVRSISLGFASTRAGQRLAVDAAGWVYVLSADGGVDPEITVVAPPGTSAPQVTYPGSTLGLAQPLDLTGVGGEVAIIDNDSNAIEIYNLRVGSTTRTRYIAAGSATETRIFSPQAIDSDAAGHLVISGRNWVSVFAAGADSTTNPALAPQRYIAGARTGLGEEAARYTTGVGLDARGAVLVGTVDYYVLPDEVTSATRNQRILKFAPGTTGDVAPYAVLAGARTGLGDLSGFDVARSGQLVTNRADLTTQTYTAAVSVHRPLGPYAVPGKARGLKAGGGKKAAKRTVSWQPALADADVPVTSYAVRVTCKGQVKVNKTQPAGVRSVSVKLGKVKRGSCFVRVTARNLPGTGAAATTSFKVRR